MTTGSSPRPSPTLPDPAMQFAPQPLISGIGRYGHTLSLQWLRERGARLLGHATGVAERPADARRRPRGEHRLGRRAVRGMTARDRSPHRAQGLPRRHRPRTTRPTQPHPDPASVHAPTTLDFDAAGISAVIWTTGVRGDWAGFRRPSVGAGRTPGPRRRREPASTGLFVHRPAVAAQPGVGDPARCRTGRAPFLARSDHRGTSRPNRLRADRDAADAGGQGDRVKITAIEPFVCDGGLRQFGFLKVTTDEGIVGWSEIYDFTAVASLATAIRIIGQEVHRPGPVPHRVVQRADVVPRPAGHHGTDQGPRRARHRALGHQGQGARRARSTSCSAASSTIG